MVTACRDFYCLTQGVHSRSLIGESLAEIARIAEIPGLSGCEPAVAVNAGWPGISARACARNSACNVLFQPECNRVHEDRTQDCRRDRRAHRHPA